MASTGMVLDGKFAITWNGTSLERVGEGALPDTTENEQKELVSNMATRKKTIVKKGYEPLTATLLFRPETKSMLTSAKETGAIGTLGFSLSAADGGAYSETYDAQVVSVGGGSGDVEGDVESFDATFLPMKRLSATGSLGTQEYD